MSLTKNTLRLRKEYNYSQRKLSTLSGVSAVHISMIERGIAQNVGLDIVVKLANTFNVTVGELIGETLTTASTQVNKVMDFVYKDLKGLVFTPDELYLIQLANQMALTKINHDRG